jgi:hypothetical protein
MAVEGADVTLVADGDTTIQLRWRRKSKVLQLGSRPTVLTSKKAMRNEPGHVPDVL